MNIVQKNYSPSLIPSSLTTVLRKNGDLCNIIDNKLVKLDDRVIDLFHINKSHQVAMMGFIDIIICEIHYMEIYNVYETIW